MQPWVVKATLSLVATGAGLEPLTIPSIAQDEATSQEIEVVANRSGAPVWTATADGRKLILVGAIQHLPVNVEWNVKELERATAQADRVILPIENQVSVGDVLRLTFRFSKAGSLPQGTTTADYLAPEVQQQLEQHMQSRPINGWRTKGFVFLGMALMKQAGQKRADWTGADRVQRAARKAKVPATPLEVVPGEDWVDALLDQSPANLEPCIAAAVTAAQAGPEQAQVRGAAWVSRDIVTLMENPLDIAISKCWPWGDPAIGGRLRSAWFSALVEEQVANETVLAIAPVRLLAEEGGVLDLLEAKDFVISGPRWRR